MGVEGCIAEVMTAFHLQHCTMFSHRGRPPTAKVDRHRLWYNILHYWPAFNTFWLMPGTLRGLRADSTS